MSKTSEINLEPVWQKGKCYRKGFTTGTCATAAAKVASLMILQQQVIHQVSVDTPAGIKLNLSVETPMVTGKDSAVAAIKKDGGDDVDATHGMLIFARVEMRQDNLIQIKGGEGIGRVTKPGIGLPLGEAAINKTPRQTIEQAVREVIGPLRGADIEIFAPEGQERAKKTFNGRLGIEGGISVIGTTGIVTPMSEDSWKRSLSIELQQKREMGSNQVILVPGNYGARFVSEKLHLSSHHVVTMSNFVGFMLQEAERLQFRHLLLAGHVGKLIKVAAGVFHTHSHVADARMETLVAHLALLGMGQQELKKVYCSNTTEEAIILIKQFGFERVYEQIAQSIVERINTMMRYAKNSFTCDVVLFSMDNTILGSNRNVDAITGEFK
ncbi:cobalt-precorrin-5B (C(1))-methyltransferase CbiD [Vibrio viridaestus]|nr:cobalt-precorrin-5B (C(1))-methyltransferase CbiD [Vibrio viridaestus]